MVAIITFPAKFGKKRGVLTPQKKYVNVSYPLGLM